MCKGSDNIGNIDRSLVLAAHDVPFPLQSSEHGTVLQDDYVRIFHISIS
jgi:hypothetical protein